MTLFIKLQPLFIITSALVGLFLGYITPFGNLSVKFIEPFLMLLLYFVFLTVDNSKFKKSLSNIKFTLSSLTVNFVWTPIFAFVLGKVFFGNNTDLQIGLLMLLVTPCTDWYLVFTGIAKGNVSLSASILPLNLLLQILLLPVYLIIFFGGNVSFDVRSIIMSISLVLIIPFLFAFLTKILRKVKIMSERNFEQLKSSGDNMQTIFCCAVICMFASESKSIIENPILLLKVLLPLVVFYASNILLSKGVSKKLNFSAEDTTSLIFTTIARNSPLSLAIAVAAFSNRPLIALSLIIGTLLELPVLSVIATLIKKQVK